MDSILIVEDRTSLRQVYATFLKKNGYLVDDVRSVEDAREMMKRREYALVLTDYMLPGASGLDFLKQLKAQDPDFSVIIMTAFGEIKMAVKAVKDGAFDFLEKPVDLEYLKMVVSRALEHRRLKRNNAFHAQGNHEREPRIIGDSAKLKQALSLLDKVAPAEANCLLLGESGVGKELFAKRVHYRSPRASGPLITLNCASIPQDLIESELFGHEKGAFTGAVSKKVGLVEMADGGTLFLDEIGELPLALQPKLLRLLQEREFFRVGGTRMVKSDVRVVCATNRHLQTGIREGWFREDLYFRLAVFPIQLPPLRQRPEDLEALVTWFLKRKGLTPPHLDPRLMENLKAYSWPGNVRELENLLERAVILSQGEPLQIHHFPQDMFRNASLVSTPITIDLSKNLKENAVDWEPFLEEQLIRLLMRETSGNREQTARRLGVSVKTLYNKMSKYNLLSQSPKTTR